MRGHYHWFLVGRAFPTCSIQRCDRTSSWWRTYHEEEDDDENDDFHSHIIDYFSLGQLSFLREKEMVFQAWNMLKNHILRRHKLWKNSPSSVPELSSRASQSTPSIISTMWNLADKHVIRQRPAENYARRQGPPTRSRRYRYTSHGAQFSLRREHILPDPYIRDNTFSM